MPLLYALKPITIMIHLIATIAFALLFTKYLSWEFKKPVGYRKNYSWLIATAIVIVIAVWFSYYDGGTFGNLILHGVGGGVATALVFEYLICQFGVRVSWRVELLLLFALVSSLGALNELAEYAADVAGYGTFSFDRMDTWRDILANTTGALVCWGCIKAVSATRKKYKSGV